MSQLDPVVLSHLFADDPDASGEVDVAQLDAMLAILKGAIDGHSDVFQSLLRGDQTLADNLIRLRNLHPEVVSTLQLIAQASETGLRFVPGAKVTTTANITLSGTQTIDGVALVAGDIVLVKDQTAKAENGVWVVAAGAWTRHADADSWDALLNTFCWVDRGTANSATGWAIVADEGGTIDVDPVSWTLVYRAASSLTQLDPTALSTATPDPLADYLLLHDVSAGALRRALISALPFLASTTTHGDLAGLGDDDHPQYLQKAGGTMTGAVAMGNHKITGLATPTADSDAATKAYADAAASTAAAMPAGMVGHTAASTPPTGWLVRDGSAVSRTTYATLFAAIGTTYGVGDGSTTFNLPNALGRVDMGSGTGAGGGASGTGVVTGGDALTARSVGAWGGEETHTLNITEMPSHHHQFDTQSGGGSTGPAGTGTTTNNNLQTHDTGGGGAHNNVQPFLVHLPIIKT